MSGEVDSVSLISSVINARESATADQRQVAVAVNAARSEQATVNVLLEAIQQTASYGARGQMHSGAVTGSRFAALA